ncbi:hypothetical protein CR513_39038, partial [Mucuna pruriens]
MEERTLKHQTLKLVLQVPQITEKSCIAKQQSIKKLISDGSVFMGNNHALEIAGVGTVKIKMYDGTVRTIQGVRHVEGLEEEFIV